MDVSLENAKGPGPSGAEEAGAWRDTPRPTTHRVNLQANPFPLVNRAAARGGEVLSHGALSASRSLRRLVAIRRHDPTDRGIML